MRYSKDRSAQYREDTVTQNNTDSGGCRFVKGGWGGKTVYVDILFDYAICIIN